MIREDVPGVDVSVMADVLTLVFRTFMTQTELQTTATGSSVPTAGSSVPTAGGGVLLVGERSISRSVLLLAAVTAASELGLRVVVFTQTQIQSLPVPLQRRVPSLSPGSLKKTRFCYPRTVEELLQQVASLHEPHNTCPAPPSLIIVDGLEGFLRAPGRPAEPPRAAHLSALLCDTAAFLTRLLEQQPSGSAPCRLLASYQPDGGDPSDTDPILDVLDRFFQVRCTLDQSGGDEAAAAGPQQRWQIYLSGRGVAEDGGAAALQWELLLFSDGLMEFKVV